MSAQATLASWVNRLGAQPFVGKALRRAAHLFPEGSVVTVRTGALAGLRWRRHHRYVNGYWIGNYELPVQAALARLLSPGRVFYDVGANAGFFSMQAAKAVGSAGRVFSFEPLPENGSSVLEQVELNAMSQVRLVNLAVGRAPGTATFSFAAGGNALAHLGAARTPSELSMEVGVTSLDDFTRSNPAPDVLKMDVEGAEVDVLEGAERLLAERHPDWLIELHGEDLGARCVEILSRHGYRFERLDGSVPADPGREAHLVARVAR